MRFDPDADETGEGFVEGPARHPHDLHRFHQSTRAEPGYSAAFVQGGIKGQGDCIAYLGNGDGLRGEHHPYHQSHELGIEGKDRRFDPNGEGAAASPRSVAVNHELAR